MELLDIETELSDLNIQCIHVSAEEGESGACIHGGLLDQKLKVAGTIVLLRVGRSDSVQIGIGEKLHSSFQIDRLRKASVHLICVLSVSCLGVAIGQSVGSNLFHRDQAGLVQQVPSDRNVVLVHSDRNGDDGRPVGGDNTASHLFDGK